MKGHIRRSGKRSWSVVVYLGRDANGRAQYKWHTVRGSKRDAQRELTELLNAINTGDYVPPNKMTVAEYLEHWLRDHAEHKVAGRTLHRYREIVHKHLIPALGRFQLSKLQPLHIQSYYSDALNNGRRDGRGGLSPTTVLQHHRVLRVALQQAVKLQLLSRNPADPVDPPRKVKTEMTPLDEGQTVALVTAAQGRRIHLPILLAVATGIRRGEILALQWKDVDFSSRTMAVRRSIDRTDLGLCPKPPKSGKSRLIALPKIVVKALKKHRAEQAAERLQKGPAYEDNDLVCPAPDGRIWNPEHLSDAFRALIRRLDLPRVRFHDLRHTRASQLMRMGVHPKVVSERLGHSTVGITLDTYSHVLPSLQEEAAEKTDVALGSVPKRDQ